MSKKNFFLFFLSILCIDSYSQITFEKGWFIDETDRRVECYIKNLDWKNNPSRFEYKLLEDSEINKNDIQKIKEFGIYNVSKYIKAEVQIDKSSNDVANLSGNKDPEFHKEILFLKSILEGDASLYQYKNGNLVRFFYKVNDTEISQLIYVRYLTEKNSVAENEYYKRQLFDDLKCKDIYFDNLTALNYNKKDLKDFFVRYNDCKKTNYINFESEKKNDLFNLSFRPGINYSNLSMRNPQAFSSMKYTEYDSKLNFRFGVEAEFIFPFNKNKWSLFLEPTYQYFKAQKNYVTSNVSGGAIIVRTDYQSIELPLGVRHYLFLKNGSRIFVNAAYVIDLSFNSSTSFKRMDDFELSFLKMKSRNNFAFGCGFKYKNTYSLETRYNSSRNVLGNYNYWNSNYKTISVILGYTVF